MFWAGVPHTARSAPPALLGSFFVIPYTDNTWRNTPDPARVLNSLLPKANADFIRSEIKELNNTKRSETAKAPHFTITRTSPTCSWSAARPDTTRYDNLLSSPRRLAPPSLSSPANHQGKKMDREPLPAGQSRVFIIGFENFSFYYLPRRSRIVSRRQAPSLNWTPPPKNSRGEGEDAPPTGA